MNLLTIALLKDGTYARQLLNYASYDEALSAMYMSIASAIANEQGASYMAELIDDNGRVLKCERWSRQSAFTQMSDTHSSDLA